MFDRFVTILLLESHQEHADELKKSIIGNGNNPISTDNFFDATNLIHNQPIGIVLINLEQFANQTKQFVDEITSSLHFQSPVIIGYIADGCVVETSFFTLNLSDVWLTGSTRYMKEKLENWKKIYFEKKRISGMLIQLYPTSILADFQLKQHTEPVKIENAIILFMDFVNFSFKSRNLSPLRVVRKLTKYFNRFDEIISRYELEKIKTIGDAYMVIGGVTEKNPCPAIRVCLAALEIKSYMENQKRVAEAFNRDFWEIRIGIHSGPLVAGVIGKSKFHYDVWGDSVNIASRTEQASRSNTILLTENVKTQVEKYLFMIPDHSLEIPKRGGKINLFELKGKGFQDKDTLKSCLEYGELEYLNFTKARKFIIHQLKAMLPDFCVYHSVNHSLDVEKAVVRFAKLEGIGKHEILLLRTAALLHDIGFIVQYHENENFAIEFAQMYLPNFDYSTTDIEIIQQCIHATTFTVKPKNQLEKLLCDADLDYLGRSDYYELAAKLRMELEYQSKFFNEKEWIDFQLHFLENTHEFHSQAAQNIRGSMKQQRIFELKSKIA
jgi:class 3 adenylate cyclase/predicted metal-dependent HD superfamily phosphohydrolase